MLWVKGKSHNRSYLSHEKSDAAAGILLAIGVEVLLEGMPRHICIDFTP